MMEYGIGAVSDTRRKEIIDQMESPAKAADYLDRIHNTIVLVHDQHHGEQLAEKIRRVKAILTVYIQSLPMLSGEWGVLYDRARDYRQQCDSVKFDFSRQVVSPGAEVVVEEDDVASYQVSTSADGASLISSRTSGEQADDYDIIILD